MAKSEPNASQSGEAQPASAPASAAAQIQVDDESVAGTYANFCRVTGSPEELIIDFGLNSQPMAPTATPIEVTQRLIVNYFTAKRLLGALSMAIQRHESAFGVLETDVQKRLKRPPQ